MRQKQMALILGENIGIYCNKPNKSLDKQPISSNLVCIPRDIITLQRCSQASINSCNELTITTLSGKETIAENCRHVTLKSGFWPFSGTRLRCILAELGQGCSPWATSLNLGYQFKFDMGVKTIGKP